MARIFDRNTGPDKARTRLLQAEAVMLSSLLCVWPPPVSGALASARQTIRIQVVDYPRPVLAAVRQIERQFGRVVTYEDPRYVHPSDIVDVTDQSRRSANISNRILQMRSGSIDVAYTPGSGGTDAHVAALLQEVLTHSRAVGNTGELRIVKAGRGWHVVPVAMEGASGVMERYVPPFDVRISLPRREESGFELMSRVAQAVTLATGSTVTAGTMPLNRMLQARVKVAAENEPARSTFPSCVRSRRHQQTSITLVRCHPPQTRSTPASPAPARYL